MLKYSLCTEVVGNSVWLQSVLTNFTQRANLVECTAWIYKLNWVEHNNLHVAIYNRYFTRTQFHEDNVNFMILSDTIPHTQWLIQKG